MTSFVSGVGGGGTIHREKLSIPNIGRIIPSLHVNSPRPNRTLGGVCKAWYSIRIASGAVSLDRNLAIDLTASSWVGIFLTVSGGARRARTVISPGRGPLTPAGLRALRSGLIGNLFGSGIRCWPILSSD